MIPGLRRSPGEGIGYPLQCSWASLMAQLVKNPPAMRETWFLSLDWEDSPGEGEGYPLQYSGLENPRDGGAWWVAVYGAAQSQTRLKQLSSSSSRDLFKKIRDTKGTLHAKMGLIKDRNGMGLTEAEDIKKRWQESIELYKKRSSRPR